MIQSPASRAARRRSCQVRSVSVASVRSRRPKANQRASSSASRNRRSARNSSGCRPVTARRVAEPALHGGEERPADAVDGADAGRDALLPGEVVGIGQIGEAAPQRCGERVRVVGQVGEGRAERLGRIASLGDERDGPGGHLALGRGRHHDRRPLGGRASRSSRPRPMPARPGGRRSGPGGRACGRCPPRRTRRSRSRARRRSTGSTIRAAVSTIRRRDRVIQPSARIGAPTSIGRRNSTDIRAVTPQLSSPTRAQAMTSSRIVHRIPPWMTPSQPSNRRSSASSVHERPGSTCRARPRPPALSVPHAKQLCGRNSNRPPGVSIAGRASRAASDVKVLDLPRLGLDEVLARADLLAHEHREDLVGQRPRSRRRPAGASASRGSSSSPRADRRSSRRGP